MKITTQASVLVGLVLAAGCSDHERQARYDQNYSTPAYGQGSSSGATYSGGNTQSAQDQQNQSSQQQNQNQQSFQQQNQSQQNQQAGTTATTSTSGGLSQSDQQLISQVQQAINNDSSLLPLSSSVQITAQGGTVTLSGSVPTEQDKQKIEAAAKNAGTSVNINNQLQVSNQSSSPTAGDQSSVPPSSTGQSQSGLSLTSDQNSSRIYAKGQTDASAAQSAASSVASSAQSAASDASQSTASGLDSFSKNIKGRSESDRAVAKQMSQELKADSSTAGMMENVKIEISDGKATLSGNVNSEDEKSKIESAVKKVSGITSVDDQLKVGSSSSESATTPKPEQ